MEQAFPRLTQAIDYLKDNGRIHKQQDIADALGMGKARVSEALQGKAAKFTMGFLKRFAAAYSDYINEAWLLTGEGEMAVPAKSMRPHVEAKAAAGFMAGIANGETECRMREAIVGAPAYDFTITVDGDSMEPELHDGDILACSIVSDRLNLPIGKICVIDSRESAVVKVLAAVKRSSITLHSFNPKYRDYDVAASDVYQIARVVALTRTYS